MRLAAALICLALILPAPAAFAGELCPAQVQVDQPTEVVVAIGQAAAPERAEGALAHQVQPYKATSPTPAVSSSNWLAHLLGIIFGQDRIIFGQDRMAGGEDASSP
jgi:hypothetical protein